MSANIRPEVALEEKLEKMNSNPTTTPQKPVDRKTSSMSTGQFLQKDSDSDLDLDWDKDYLSIISDLNTLEQDSYRLSIEDQLEDLLVQLDRQAMIIEDYKSQDMRTIYLSSSEIACLVKELDSLNIESPSRCIQIGNKIHHFSLKSESEVDDMTIKPLHKCDELPIYMLTPKGQRAKSKELLSTIKQLEEEIKDSGKSEIELERRKTKINNLRGEKAIYDSIKSSKSIFKSLKNIKSVGAIRKEQAQMEKQDCPELKTCEDHYYEQRKLLLDIKHEAKFISKGQHLERILIEKQKKLLKDREVYIDMKINYILQPLNDDLPTHLSQVLSKLNDEYSRLQSQKENFYTELSEFNNTKANVERQLLKYNSMIIKNRTFLQRANLS